MPTLGDIGGLMLERTTGLSRVRALCAMAGRHHAAAEPDAARQMARDAESAVRADDGKNRDVGFRHVAEAYHALGYTDDVQRICTDMASHATGLEGREKVYAWCVLAELQTTLDQSDAACTALEHAEQAAQSLAGIDRIETLVDIAGHYLHAGRHGRAAALVTTIDTEAMSLTGKDRAATLGLVADIRFDLGTPSAAQMAIAEAVASAGSCDLLERIMVLTSATETYISLGDTIRAREVLEQATRDLFASEEADNEIMRLCIARAHGARADVPAVFELVQPMAGMGRVRVLTSVASIMHGKHKDDAAATGMIAAAFESVVKLGPKMRQRAIDRLAPLCLELGDLSLGDEQHKRLAEIVQRLIGEDAASC